jgi:hypothetical protein
MIKPEFKNAVRQKLQGKSEAEMVKMVELAAEQRGARFQFNILMVIQQIAIDNGAPAGGVSLADVIMAEQNGRLQRYGDKAFPLSTKQIAVVVRESYPFFNS